MSPTPLNERAIHTPSGFSCLILIRDGPHCFCNFGDRCNPFCWTLTSELQTESELSVA